MTRFVATIIQSEVCPDTFFVRHKGKEVYVLEDEGLLARIDDMRQKEFTESLNPTLSTATSCGTERSERVDSDSDLLTNPEPRPGTRREQSPSQAVPVSGLGCRMARSER